STRAPAPFFAGSVNSSKNSLLTPISLGPWWPSLTITFLISSNLPSSNRPLILWLLSYQEVSKLVSTWILFFLAKDSISLASAKLVAKGFSTITWTFLGAQALTTAICSEIAPNAETASGLTLSNISSKLEKNKDLSN